MTNILELKNVCKKYKDFSLENISFSLEKGFIMGFIGPNGAGKSTTIRCIMDLVHVDKGDISIFEENTRDSMKQLKQRIGFVYDQDVFFEELSVEKNKRIVAGFYNSWDDELFYRYIKEFGVPLNKPVKSLSKGTKMKLALAVALSHHAELIIMDEPTSGLDPVFRKEMLDILRDIIQDENKAIFFSTHITTDLEQIADYITFILDGKILFSKETESLLEEYIVAKGPSNKSDIIKAFNPIYVKESSLGFEAFIKNDRNIIAQLGDEIRFERPTLDDIMYSFVKQNTMNKGGKSYASID